MKKITKLITILFALILILTGCASQVQEPDPSTTPDLSPVPDSAPDSSPALDLPDISIGILKWVTHAALDESEQGFLDALRDNGFVDGENLSVDFQNANDNASVAATISDRFVNNNVDLVLAIATPAVQSIQAKTSSIPIVGTAVTDFALAGLVDSNELPGGNITGTSDRTPVKEQFELLQSIAPDINKVGILYNSSEDNSRIQAESAVSVADSLGIEVVIKTFSSVNDIPQTADSLAREVDAFWLPTDNTLSSAIGVLANTATEHSIPVVCGEENMVYGGGTFTIGINYYNLGYQAGEMAVRILKFGENPADMPIEFQKNMAIVINSLNADQIGFVFPDDIISQAIDASA